MRKHSSIMWLMLVAVLFVASCGGRGGSVSLTDSRDSLSYVVGMNIAYNIMQMDSTINADAVITAIDETLRGRERFSLEEGKTYLLGYINYDVYERVRGYEEQYLNDLAASDGDVVRTPNGLTYKVATLGDMNQTVNTERDTIAFTYRATNLAGEEVDPASERADTLRTRVDQLVPGLRDGVRLVGQGGSLTLWLPSSMAYGSAGDSEKGIKSNEMLRYDVQIIEVKHRR
ncbi:MAG: FKBP-type peptidyl-prolyl cis-trans isomerase [Alistipes sp.]|nr:FKBP-type peptidyl-prolyl cis-trans isomerase [Alistipes sp.]